MFGLYTCVSSTRHVLMCSRSPLSFWRILIRLTMRKISFGISSSSSYSAHRSRICQQTFVTRLAPTVPPLYGSRSPCCNKLYHTAVAHGTFLPRWVLSSKTLKSDLSWPSLRNPFIRLILALSSQDEMCAPTKCTTCQTPSRCLSRYITFE